MTVSFADPCGSALGGTEGWTSVTGSVSVSATTPRTGSRCILGDSTGTNQPAYVSSTAAGNSNTGRVSFGFWASAAPASNIRIAKLGLAWSFALRLNTNRTLQLDAVGAGTQNGTLVLATSTYYRLTVTWNVTNSTTYTMSLFIGDIGVPDATITNVGTLTVLNNDVRFGWVDAPGASKTCRVDDVVVDTDGSNTNPGDYHVTIKRAAANNTNGFDTSIGAAPANRWENVDDLPTDETTGWRHNAATDVQENYGLMAASGGEVDIAASVIVARQAYLWAKSALPPSATATNTGKATGTTLTLGAVTVAAGDVVVVNFTRLVAAATIADDLTNSWTALTGATSTCTVQAWYSVIANAGSMTVTLTFASSNAARAGALAVWPAAAFLATPLDKNPAAATLTASPYTSGSSGTLAQANELIVYYVGLAADNGDTLGITAPTEEVARNGTTGGSSASNCIARLATDIVIATTALTRSSTEVSTTTADGVAGIATFKLATPAAKIMDNGTEAALTLSSISAYKKTTLQTDAVYPSDPAGVGIRSTGTATNTVLYEAGAIIVYIPIWWAAIGGR